MQRQRNMVGRRIRTSNPRNAGVGKRRGTKKRSEGRTVLSDLRETGLMVSSLFRCSSVFTSGGYCLVSSVLS